MFQVFTPASAHPPTHLIRLLHAVRLSLLLRRLPPAGKRRHPQGCARLLPVLLLVLVLLVLLLLLHVLLLLVVARLWALLQPPRILQRVPRVGSVHRCAAPLPQLAQPGLAARRCCSLVLAPGCTAAAAERAILRVGQGGAGECYAVTCNGGPGTCTLVNANYT